MMKAGRVGSTIMMREDIEVESLDDTVLVLLAKSAAYSRIWPPVYEHKGLLYKFAYIQGMNQTQRRSHSGCAVYHFLRKAIS